MYMTSHLYHTVLTNGTNPKCYCGIDHPDYNVLSMIFVTILFISTFTVGEDFDEFPRDITNGLLLSLPVISIDLSIIDDDLPEGSESFHLVLNSTYDFIVFATQRTQVTIVDNDCERTVNVPHLKSYLCSECA